jgi:hypothetical protein
LHVVTPTRRRRNRPPRAQRTVAALERLLARVPEGDGPLDERLTGLILPEFADAAAGLFRAGLDRPRSLMRLQRANRWPDAVRPDPGYGVPCARPNTEAVEAPQLLSTFTPA